MTVYLVGAGFSKAVRPSSPLNNQLVAELRAKPGSALAELPPDIANDDIEIALTRLDLAIAQGAGGGLLALRARVQSELAVYFQNSVARQDDFDTHAWLERFIDEFVVAGDVVISLNYDCLIEGLLDLRGKWSPNGGYGKILSRVYEHEYGASAVQVLKPHGSCNFVQAPSFPEDGTRVLGLKFDEHFHPVSAKHKHHDFGLKKGESHIIAPSYVKKPTLELNYLLLDAMAAIKAQTRLVIVGSSLRPEDISLTLLYTHFFHQPGWNDRRLIVVDPHAEAICTRVRDFWTGLVDKNVVPIASGLGEGLDALEAALA